jgi:hypothetical protein
VSFLPLEGPLKGGPSAFWGVSGTYIVVHGLSAASQQVNGRRDGVLLRTENQIQNQRLQVIPIQNRSEGPEPRLFGSGSREGFVWCVRPGAADKAHDENGVVVATESNDKPTLPSFSFTS